MSLAEVVPIYESSLLDVPAKLRKLADDLDAGTYGVPGCCAVALLADNLIVFGFGPDSGGPSVHILLSAACRTLEQGILDHGQE